LAEVTSFPGVRYQEEIGADLSALVAPPYDVIPPTLQRELHARHPHNVIHLEFGLPQPADSPGDDQYTRAAGWLNEWLATGVLGHDEPSLYVCEEEFVDQQGRTRQRTGLVASVRLQEFSEGGIKPHELTRAAPKADRLNLLRATRANLSSIFALCDEPTGVFDQRLSACVAAPPLATAVGPKGVTSRLWRIGDPAMIVSLQTALRDAPLFIADGHHRYETALNYRAEQRAANAAWSGEEPPNFVMMTIASTRNPGLAIFPTHRLLRFTQAFDLNRLCAEAAPYFNVADCEPRAPAGAEVPTFVLATRARTIRLTLKSAHGVAHWLSAQSAANELDVTILHDIIIDRLFPAAGVPSSALALDYTADDGEAIASLQSGASDCVCLMQATRMEQVLAMSWAGEKLPSKSTYFYPKLLTGLVLRSLA